MILKLKYFFLLVSSSVLNINNNEETAKKQRIIEKKNSIELKNKTISTPTDEKKPVLPKDEENFMLDIETGSFYSQIIPNKLPNIPTVIVLNEKTTEIRAEISDNGKYVTWKEIIYLRLTFYKCKHIGEFGLTHATHLETINELVRFQRKIDSFILEYNLTIIIFNIFNITNLKWLCVDI